jgi:hypothetical protein
MTDSLSRLVLRAQGRMAVAAPLLPSRFAGVAAEGGWGEEVSETIVTTQSPGRTFDPPTPQRQPATQRAEDAAPPMSSDADVSPASETARTLALQVPPRQSLPEQPQRAIHAVARPTITDPLDATRRFIAAETLSNTPRIVVLEQSHSPEPMPSAAVRPAPVPPPIERGLEQPRPVQGNVMPIRSMPEVTAALSRVPPSIVPRQTDSVPEVRISIGRVEVHAPSAPTAPGIAPRQTPARRPTVTLADYLAERGRSR